MVFTSKNYAYILINDQKWWNRRLNKSKIGKTIHAFVRRGLVGPKDTRFVLFYVKHPLKELRGRGEFIERITGNTDELWNSHSHETVFKSYKEYSKFLQGKTETTFVRLQNVQELSAPVSMQTVSRLLGVSRMPRGGRYIDRETFEELVGTA